jgi:preprotein translocase subunit Sss1
MVQSTMKKEFRYKYIKARIATILFYGVVGFVIGSMYIVHKVVDAYLSLLVSM